MSVEIKQPFPHLRNMLSNKDYWIIHVGGYHHIDLCYKHYGSSIVGNIICFNSNDYDNHFRLVINYLESIGYRYYHPTISYGDFMVATSIMFIPHRGIFTINDTDYLIRVCDEDAVSNSDGNNILFLISESFLDYIEKQII